MDTLFQDQRHLGMIRKIKANRVRLSRINKIESYRTKGGLNLAIHRIDHVGIIVNDLTAVKEFFIEFGLEVLGEGEVDGKWAERIIGFTDVKATIVLLGMSDGQANLELVKFHTDSEIESIQQSLKNHIAFAVEDIETVVVKLKKKGAEIISETQNYNNIYKLCFVQGPEGIILELAEKMR